MFQRWSTGRPVVGIDIGEASIKAAQVVVTGRGPRLGGALRLQRASVGGALTDAEAGRLVRAMDRRAFSLSRVVLVAPAQQVVSAGIDLPPADAHAARDRIVQMEINRTHRLPVDGFECCWWELPAGHPSRGTAAHAIALPHAAIRPTLAVLSRVGIDVQRTVPPSAAIAAAAQRFPVDPRRITAVIDFGLRSARLAMMHAGRVVHERGLPDFNAHAIAEQTRSALGIGQALTEHALACYGLRDEPDGRVESEVASALAQPIAHLCEEIGMSFAYVSHHYPQAELGPVLLTGGPANLPGLPHAMLRTLELDVSVLSPASIMTCDCFGNEGLDPALSAAVGGALMEGGGDETH